MLRLQARHTDFIRLLSNALRICHVAYHMNDMESNGLSIQQIASNFMASPEFKPNTEKIYDDAYINALYQNVLDRSASSYEIDYYRDQLEGVFLMITSSD